MGRLKDNNNYLSDEAKKSLVKARIDIEKISGSESKYLQMLYEEYIILNKELDNAIKVINNSKVSLKKISDKKNIARSSFGRFTSIKLFKQYLDYQLNERIDQEIIVAKENRRILQEQIEALQQRDIEYMLMKDRIEELESILSKYIQ